MLENAASNPLIVAAIALSGVLLGLAIGRFLLPGSRKIKRLESEIEQMRRDHADYRARVSTHFNTTGELIGQMTASYKAVYDHLSEGAQILCGDGARSVITFTRPKLIIAENVEITSAGARTGSPDIPEPLVTLPTAPAALAVEVSTPQPTVTTSPAPAEPIEPAAAPPPR